MVNKNNILILEGGYNEEHEVSLNSSSEIQKILKKNKIKYKVLLVNPKNFEKKILRYKNYICFNALHGPFGEDGQIQKILKKNKIKFTHSNYISSRNCFDKMKTKKIVSANKILTPKFLAIKKEDLNPKNLYSFKKVFKKFVVKPTSSGSSYGIKIIRNNNELRFFLSEIDKFKNNLSKHSHIMIEEFISGIELTVSTIEIKNKITPLAVTEIISNNSFFDYEAKYSKGFSKHIIPARISKINYNKCLKLASKLHKILKCKSISRSDFILNPYSNNIYYLETNTQPGLTSLSLFPEQVKYMNFSFEQIVFSILNKTN